MELICFKCDKKILVADSRFMVAIEKPYGNLWFHRSCYNEIKDNLEQYLLTNIELVYNILYNQKNQKLSKKIRKN